MGKLYFGLKISVGKDIRGKHGVVPGEAIIKANIPALYSVDIRNSASIFLPSASLARFLGGFRCGLFGSLKDVSSTVHSTPCTLPLKLPSKCVGEAVWKLGGSYRSPQTHIDSATGFPTWAQDSCFFSSHKDLTNYFL